MTKTPIIPATQQAYYDKWQFAPGMAADGFLFLSGATGVLADGTVPADIETQIHRAFECLGEVLTQAGCSFADIVEITTYHVGIASQLTPYKAIKASYIPEPHPAWTAIGITELATPGALIEIRAIARCTTLKDSP